MSLRSTMVLLQRKEHFKDLGSHFDGADENDQATKGDERRRYSAEQSSMMGWTGGKVGEHVGLRQLRVGKASPNHFWIGFDARRCGSAFAKPRPWIFGLVAAAVMPSCSRLRRLACAAAE